MTVKTLGRGKFRYKILAGPLTYVEDELNRISGGRVPVNIIKFDRDSAHDVREGDYKEILIEPGFFCLFTANAKRFDNEP